MDQSDYIRLGEEFQAQLPEFNPDRAACYAEEERIALLWRPNPQLPDATLDEYILVAKQNHGYNVEQALGLMQWYQHDVELALANIANFSPIVKEWTAKEKEAFEEAFSRHGKRFHLIHKMLPERPISSLVEFYYSWKKTRQGWRQVHKSSEAAPKKNPRWTTEEQRLAVQAFRHHGKNFTAVAKEIGSKTRSQVRHFFRRYRHRCFNLDEVVTEWAAEQVSTSRGQRDGEDVQMKMEDSLSAPPASPQMPTTSSSTFCPARRSAPLRHARRTAPYSTSRCSCLTCLA